MLTYFVGIAEGQVGSLPEMYNNLAMLHYYG